MRKTLQVRQNRHGPPYRQQPVAGNARPGLGLPLGVPRGTDGPTELRLAELWPGMPAPASVCPRECPEGPTTRQNCSPPGVRIRPPPPPTPVGCPRWALAPTPPWQPPTLPRRVLPTRPSGTATLGPKGTASADRANNASACHAAPPNAATACTAERHKAAPPPRQLRRGYREPTRILGVKRRPQPGPARTGRGAIARRKEL